jgi:hypothetical protein
VNIACPHVWGHLSQNIGASVNNYGPGGFFYRWQHVKHAQFSLQQFSIVTSEF